MRQKLISFLILVLAISAAALQSINAFAADYTSAKLSLCWYCLYDDTPLLKPPLHAKSVHVTIDNSKCSRNCIYDVNRGNNLVQIGRLYPGEKIQLYIPIQKTDMGYFLGMKCEGRWGCSSTGSISFSSRQVDKTILIE